MARNNLRKDLLENSTSYQLFNKRYVDFNKEELRQYNRIVQQRRRAKLNGFSENRKKQRVTSGC